MISFFQSKKKVLLPDWLEEYLALDFRSKSPIDSVTFVVLDCETTGLQKTDHILTIGAVKCTTSEILIQDPLDQLYPRPVTGRSSEIHGQLGETKDCQTDVLTKELIGFVSNSMIIGHNISFDIGMINKLLKENYNVKLKNRVIDTAQLAIRLDTSKYENSVGGKSNLHLDDLCNELQIKIENRHTALGDAYLTAQVFQKLIAKLKARGIKNTTEL